MSAANAPAPALSVVDAMRPSGAEAEVTTQTFVLSGWDKATSVATEPWAFLELTGPDGAGRWSHRLYHLAAADTGGWEERLQAQSDSGRPLGPDVVQYWQESANGIIWEITELTPGTLPLPVSGPANEGLRSATCEEPRP